MVNLDKINHPKISFRASNDNDNESFCFWANILSTTHDMFNQSFYMNLKLGILTGRQPSILLDDPKTFVETNERTNTPVSF